MILHEYGISGRDSRMNSAEKWLYSVPGRKKSFVLALSLLQAVSGSTGVVYALFIRSIVDNAAAGDRGGFMSSVAGIIVLVLIQLSLNALIRWLHELASCDLENCFKQRLAENILRRDYSAVSATHSGEWMNRLTNDTRVVAESYVDVLPGLVGMAVRLISAVVMIIILDHWFACILIPGGIILIVLSWAFRKVLKKLHKNIQEQDGKLRVFLQERIGSLLMIKSFAAEDETLREAEEYMARHKASRMKRSVFSNFCNVGFGAAMQGMYLIGVVYCAYGILTGTVTYGTMAAVMQLIGQVQAPFANISGYLPKYYAMLASAERLMEIEQNPPDLDGPSLTAEEIGKTYRESIQAVGLRHVSFTYPGPDCRSFADNDADVISTADSDPHNPDGQSDSGGDTDSMNTADSTLNIADTANTSGTASHSNAAVLKNISIEIEKGSYTALTGHSGCGKTTALKMLLCMYRPDKGERYIRYNDAAGQQVSGYANENAAGQVSSCVNDNAAGRAGVCNDYSAEEPLTARFRRLFAYVPQGNLLISGTIRDVVSFADPSGRDDDSRIMDALRIACADGFTKDLDNGIDTILGERGAGLSEGQMQRLAIARAIFSESPVLLLDEATSALDGKTEAALLTNLRKLTDRTVVIVTHRPAALEICDHVLRFSEDGVQEIKDS